MAGLPALDVFTTKLELKEQILRGGCLEEPVILHNLDVGQNRAFIKICQRNAALRLLLTGEARGPSLVQRHLAMFIAELRDLKQDEWGTVATELVVQVDAIPDALGSEACESPTPSAPPNKGLAPMRKNALLAQFPILTVQFPFAGETVSMAVKSVASKAEAPSLEATPANFRAMFCWCRCEVARLEGAPPPDPPGCCAQATQTP